MTTQNSNIEQNGENEGVDLSYWLKEMRLDRILNGGNRRRRSRNDRRPSSKPFTIYLDEEGRIDKQRTREERLFGRTPLYV